MLKIIIGVVVVTIAVIGAFLLIDPNVTNSATGTVTEVANTFTVAVEIIDISPSNLDPSLCFIQPGISHDILCI